MRVAVDLARRQSYRQCVFAAPEIFKLTGQEVLEYDTAPIRSLCSPSCVSPESHAPRCGPWLTFPARAGR
jgi:hypothetical protein